MLALLITATPFLVLRALIALIEKHEADCARNHKRFINMQTKLLGYSLCQ